GLHTVPYTTLFRSKALLMKIRASWCAMHSLNISAKSTKPELKYMRKPMEESFMQNRRQFIKNTLGASLLLTVPSWMNELYAKKEFTRLTILHTNDMHSRIEPFPSGNKFEG